MMLTFVLAFIVASVSSTETQRQTLAWGNYPWWCGMPDADGATGTVWVALDYCSYDVNVQITAPGASNSNMTYAGRCLGASDGQVNFQDCNESAAQQHWRFNPVGAANNFAGANNREGGQVMLMDPSMKDTPCLAVDPEWVEGTKVALETCHHESGYQVWTYLKPPPPAKTLLVMPELNWCVGVAGTISGMSGGIHAQECVEGRVAQYFVRDGGFVYAAAGQGLSSDGSPVTHCMGTTEQGVMMDECDSMNYRWKFDESLGTLMTATSPMCLTCASPEEQCYVSVCTGNETQKFAWRTSLPKSFAANDYKGNELITFEGEDQEIAEDKHRIGSGGPAGQVNIRGTGEIVLA